MLRLADTIARGAVVALAARADLATADAAMHRLHEANRQLERAGLHDRIVALALPQAMLTRLPEPKDLHLAARYLTAADHGQVGGDWYDALVLPPGTTTLVIGDVIGHDVTAAAAMGPLRNLLRALARQRNHPPRDVVARLDRAARDLRIGTAATMILLNIEPPAPTSRPAWPPCAGATPDTPPPCSSTPTAPRPCLRRPPT